MEIPHSRIKVRLKNSVLGHHFLLSDSYCFWLFVRKPYASYISCGFIKFSSQLIVIKYLYLFQYLFFLYLLYLCRLIDIRSNKVSQQ